MGVSRRSFLKLSGLTAAGSLIGGLGVGTAAAAERTGILGLGEKAMLIDVSRCIGCTSCVTACKKQNNLPEPYKNSLFTNGENWTAIKFYNTDKKEKTALVKVKMQCMHCAEASCVAVCPTGAAFKREDGVVLIDKEVCIGCKNCVPACPYAIPGESHTSKVIEKCTFCVERMAEEKPTACSEACPADAIFFGERTEMLEVARDRLERLKSEGYKDSGIYGQTELGGLKVVYILPVAPSKIGFPENPQVATGDVLLKWAMGLAAAGAVIAGPLRKAFKDGDEPIAPNQKNKGVSTRG